MSDSMVVGMWAVNLLVSLLLGGGIFILNARQRKFETMEARLQETAEQLVQSQISIKTGSLAGAIETLTGEVKRIVQRLDSGDGRMEKLGERDQRTELALKDQTRELQTWMMERFATKGDVEHVSTKVDSLADRVGQMAIAQAVAGHSGGHPAAKGA